ncbi:MFS transporter [Parapedobacter tibetensis]|uniref:MFS transporter n=1 Tax=Parapedobacter tibetensis TaxID=2972951 RepID=UPI00214D73C5|nr:MFS transporter [Parapedobacter tibetensis]
MKEEIAIKKAGTKEWIGLAIIALPCMLYSMDLTILNLAVPKLSEDLQPTSTQLLWIIDIYGFVIAGLMIPLGALGDRIGRKKLLLIGAAVFGLASVLAAFSNSANSLIASRAILGVAGATLAPSTLSLIRSMFEDPKQRTLAIGIWITSFSIGGAIGPVVGGIILEFYWWGAVFLVAIPIMILLLILGPFLLPEFKHPDPGKMDLISALMSLAAILSVVFGIKVAVKEGLHFQPVFFILLGILIGWLFIRRQQRLDNPLIDLKLFDNRKFSTSLSLNLLAAFMLFGMFLFIAQYFQLVMDFSAFEAGLWGISSGVGFIIGALTTQYLTTKFRPVFIMTAGFVLAALGFGLLLFLGGGFDLFFIVSGFAIFSLGIALVFTLVTDAIVGSAPPEQAGLASSMSETSSELGGALGIAILGSIGTLAYKNKIFRSDFQNELNIDDSLGGVIARANQLSADRASDLIVIAKEAFTNGMHWTAGISVILSLTLAFLCLNILRKVKPI